MYAAYIISFIFVSFFLYYLLVAESIFSKNSLLTVIKNLTTNNNISILFHFVFDSKIIIILRLLSYLVCFFFRVFSFLFQLVFIFRFPHVFVFRCYLFIDHNRLIIYCDENLQQLLCL